MTFTHTPARFVLAAATLSLAALAGCQTPAPTAGVPEMGAAQAADVAPALPAGVAAEAQAPAADAALPAAAGAPAADLAAAGPRAYVAAPAPLTIASVTTSARSTQAYLITDGSLTTCWSNGGSSTATVTAALSASAELTSFAMKASPVGTYAVDVSADGVTWKTVATGLKNTTWNVETKTLPAGTIGKQLRLRFSNVGKKFYVYDLKVIGGASAASPTPTPSASATVAPTTAPTIAPTTTPTAAPTVAPTAAPTATPIATTPPAGSVDRAAITGVLSDLGGMSGTASAPQNRTTSLAVSQDYKKIAITWHNVDASNNPTAWATVGDPASPGSFTAATKIGTQPFPTSSGCGQTSYNVSHNDSQALATPGGGFIGLTLGMNANGWAQCLSKMNHWVTAEVGSSGSGWSAPGLATTTSSLGRTVSEPSGNGDANGNYHVFGQGQVGSGDFSGGFGYVRKAAGSTNWATNSLASAYRPTGMNYFLEGQGYVKPGRNANGASDLHAAFAWNQQGWQNTFGLYYLKSTDGGVTWKSASGTQVTLPLRYGGNAGTAAVLPANLSTNGTYTGSSPGTRGISVAGAPDGHPVIVQPMYADSAKTKAQHVVRAFDGSSWVSVNVGPQVFSNVGGSGVAVNAVSGNVNVIVLDPGSGTGSAKVLQYTQPLADLRKGLANWTMTTVASIPTSSYASSLKTAEVPNARLGILVENNYRNPGKVSPVYMEATLR